MTVIADLSVLLSADTSKLRSGLSGVRNAIGGLGGLVAGLAGGAGLGALVTSGLNTADAIQKMNVRTGASTEFLSGLQNAASQSDVSFDSVGKAISRLNRSIGEAGDGTKAQIEAFAALGISMADLEGLDVDQRFRLVADALSKVKDESVAARVGNDIFGRGFEELRPLIAEGAKGLEEFQKQAEATGQVLSKEQVDAAAKANDEMQKLKNTVAALGTQFAVGLAPQISEALQVLNESLPGIIESAKTAFEILGKVVDVTGTVIGGAAAAAGAVFEGNFSGAAAIGSSLIDDISAIIGGDGGNEAAEETRRSNEILQDISQTLKGEFRNGVAVTG